MRVRFRIDGVLARGDDRAAAAWSRGVVSRLKIMSDLDIAERRLPAGRPRRAQRRRPPRSTSASRRCRPLYGEKVVMRILDKSNAAARPRRSSACDRRGRARASRRRSRKPYGMVLVTGPTGSGKSTTLYATLDRAQHARDEHHHGRGPGRVPARTGINQVQVNHKAGPDLRQRPALDAARRPRHHDGRRDPRRRDGADRDRGRAHRPPRALHAAHQRRADAGHRACSRWASSRSWSPPRSTACVAQRLAPHALRRLQGARRPSRRRVMCRTRLPIGEADDRGLRAGGCGTLRRHRLPRAGSASTRSCRSPTRSAKPRARRRAPADRIAEVRDARRHASSLRDGRAGEGPRRAGPRSPRSCELPTGWSLTTPVHCDPAGSRTGVQGPTIVAVRIDFAQLLLDVLERRPRPAHRRRDPIAMIRDRGRLTSLEGYPRPRPDGHPRDHLRDPQRRPAPAASRPTGSSTSPTRSRAGRPASASTPTCSAARVGRRVPPDPARRSPTLEDLGLPPVVRELTAASRAASCSSPGRPARASPPPWRR